MYDFILGILILIGYSLGLFGLFLVAVLFVKHYYPEEIAIPRKNYIRYNEIILERGFNHDES